MFGTYDAGVLVALLVGFFVGRAKGFAWQLSGIATLALGYVVATLGAPSVGRLFPDAWPLDVRRFAAWTALYAVVSVGVYLVTLRFSKRIRELELEELDRRFGGALGAFKAALLVAVVSLIAVSFSERARELVRESSSGRVLARAAVVARPLLPETMGKAVEGCVSRLGIHEPTADLEAGPTLRPAAPGPLTASPGRSSSRPRAPFRGAPLSPAPRLERAPGQAPPRRASAEPAAQPARGPSAVAPQDLDAPLPTGDRMIEPEPDLDQPAIDPPAAEPLDPLAPPR